MERGVPPGPLLGKLKAGQDVLLEDGRTVRAADVVAESEPPSAYLVIEVPDPLYMAGLEAADELLNIDHLHTVFHFSPPDVRSDFTWLLRCARDSLSFLQNGLLHRFFRCDNPLLFQKCM